MTIPSLFIGVVSHPKTRFPLNQGSNGLGDLLGKAVPQAVTKVCARNLFDETGDHVEAHSIQAALSATLHAEYEWSRHLGRTQSLGWWLTYGGRWIKRFGKRAKPPSANLIRRLLNIELAHLSLMKQGLDSGAPWIVILEDDAFTDDIEDLAAGLRSLMRDSEPRTLINLSSSFTYDKLGIDRLLTTSPRLAWHGNAPRAILQADRPVTNTVCAIAYSRELLRDIDFELRLRPLHPVIPIDWKLNLSLLAMIKSKNAGEFSCHMVDPAPIIQMSMR